jgi:hypothetical protein
MVEVLKVLEKMKEEVLRVQGFKKCKRKKGRRKSKNANFRCTNDYVE